MAGPLPHMLRSDARDNRDRLLEAARDLFSERGLGVPMREIARRADVGPATLYRRFPTKQALIDAVFADELHECGRIVKEACADHDPWRGLCTAVHDIMRLNATNQGFVDAFVSSHPGAADFATHRSDMLRHLTTLCRRAQQSGTLRPDVGVDDLILIIMGGRGLPPGPPSLRSAASQRLAALALDAFRATPAGTPLPPAPRLSGLALTLGTRQQQPT